MCFSNQFNIIAGESRLRGILLFELHATIAELGRRNADPQHLPAVLQVRTVSTLWSFLNYYFLGIEETVAGILQLAETRAWLSAGR